MKKNHSPAIFIPGHLFHDGIGIWVDPDTGYPVDGATIYRKENEMTKDFNYDHFQLAVKIYQYAERVVMFPNDQPNIDYCKEQCKLALQTCREQSLNWLPSSKTYKGKRKNMIGKVSVTVEVPWGLNSYGFSHYPQQAESIMKNLHNMWMSYIHGEELDQIVSMA